MTIKLTKAQRALLRYAKHIHDGGEFDGVSPRRGQSKMFERLRLMGLLADAGVGEIVEGDRVREAQLYEITKAGRVVLEKVVSDAPA